MPFSPDYVRLVLNENFEDAKALFIRPLLAIHYAHLIMLHEQGLVSTGDARAIRGALDAIDADALGRAAYDGTCEDLFFYVNRLIVGGAGEAAGGRLHTARSRNDVDMTLYRMRLREWLLDLADAAIALRKALLTLAQPHVATVMPAHTHTQPAQATTLAHYLLAVVEQLERDGRRLTAAYDTVNRNPLGACAITGTGFPIDRHRTSELLGFAGPTGNTYGSIASIDYVIESTAAASVLLVGLGRFVQDLLLWSTAEFGYLRLPDEFVQISSIMPQKRNPVAFEHARALSSKALGQLAAVAQVVHNTPFGDIVDTEDDLQPLVAGAFRDALRAVELVAVTTPRVTVDVGMLRERAGQGWITVTELADALVRDHGLPFGDAHRIVSRYVQAVRDAGATPDARLLAHIARELGHAIAISDAELTEILSPVRFVGVRRTLGGPAPDVVTTALAASRDLAERDEAVVRGSRQALAEAERQRRDAAATL
ncbi:MAG: argininosuccinate lyase [Acidobacteria bacterium]|nr:argininosuccinate lyase [Acidobacteriota bacterium]